MDIRVKTLPSEVLMEDYRRLLQDKDIQTLPLLVSGNSMAPFLTNGKDVVYLSRLKRQARRGDVLLYQRDNGDYVLHRVYRVHDGLMTMIGDGQIRPEPGIRQDQVMAIVTAADRKGKRQQRGCFWWFFFEKVWIRMVPFRRIIFRIYEKVKALLGVNRAL